MKKILLYTSIIVLGSLAAASCNLNSYPVFDDNDAFVSFSSTTAQFTEPAQPDTVQVYVTLASVAGITTNISYEAVDSTAKAGIDYELLDPNGVLSFNADNRTCAIDIIILNPNYGTYTGNKLFTLKLTSTGSVNMGSENSCLVTIADADHPLSSILATYTMSGESYFFGPQTWNMTVERDPNGDVTLVWFENLLPGYGGFYGTVTMGADGITPAYISIPIGQTCPANGGILYGMDAIGEYFYIEGTIPVEVSDNGNTLTFTELGPALCADPDEYSFYDIILGGCSGNKVQ